ncbi:MAG TPA: coenzyme F420 hydrogenase, partial [Firmicutes bacterium]|nr:coenzyme F420 hydrogenase [Bacillota bacterium]
MDINELRQAAAETVSRDDVKYLLGWQQGSFGYRVSPVMVEEAAGVEKLIFSPLCTSNLAVYLAKTEKLPLPRGQEPDRRKVALMVKGCDSRAVVQLLVEKGLQRDQLVILGCPCPGVVDLHLLQKKYPETAASVEMAWQEGSFLLRADGRETLIPREELLAEKCRLCRYPNPVISDLTIGETVEPREPAVDQ